MRHIIKSLLLNFCCSRYNITCCHRYRVFLVVVIFFVNYVYCMYCIYLYMYYELFHAHFDDILRFFSSCIAKSYLRITPAFLVVIYRCPKLFLFPPFFPYLHFKMDSGHIHHWYMQKICTCITTMARTLTNKKNKIKKKVSKNFISLLSVPRQRWCAKTTLDWLI